MVQIPTGSDVTLDARPVAPIRRSAGNDAVNGCLIINADDWGRDRETTDRTFDCVRRGTVSAVSAMVFMEDSERAAQISQDRGIDTGLHLNLTASLTSGHCSERLAEHQRRLIKYLRCHPLARVVFHPGLTGSFEYVVKSQIEEFQRLFGQSPTRLDGHHHMHLCSNVQRSQLLPQGILVRRNFSFQSGEKSLINRLYRKHIDDRLVRRHRLVDYLFALPPLQPERLQRMFSLARNHSVEVETHPIHPAEYNFLTQGEIIRELGTHMMPTAFPVAPSGTI
jgi:chitin disaccharide deacetylase